MLACKLQAADWRCSAGQLTAVHADDALLDEGGQGEPVEQGVHAVPGPHASLAQPLQALQAEAKERVDVAGLPQGTEIEAGSQREGWKRSIDVEHELQAGPQHNSSATSTDAACKVAVARTRCC